MSKVIYCNSFEVSHSREAVVLTFRFEAPDGNVETAYVVISPQGAVVLKDSLESQLTEYVKKYGSIEMGDWKKENPKNCNNNNNHEKYIS